VEFLLAHEAEANSKDRWNHTPLDGAIEKGHDLVAAALYARGGQMNMSAATSLFMGSARKGDLGTLKLLVENGINIDALDYDMCSALHVAAMADQPVAVDFLLSNKTTVNLLSRWNTSPLDEGIKSKSVLCAKLLVACGGQTFVHHDAEVLGVINESEMTLADVRKSIAAEVRVRRERLSLHLYYTNPSTHPTHTHPTPPHPTPPHPRSTHNPSAAARCTSSNNST